MVESFLSCVVAKRHRVYKRSPQPTLRNSIFSRECSSFSVAKFSHSGLETYAYPTSFSSIPWIFSCGHRWVLRERNLGQKSRKIFLELFSTFRAILVFVRFTFLSAKNSKKIYDEISRKQRLWCMTKSLQHESEATLKWNIIKLVEYLKSFIWWSIFSCDIFLAPNHSKLMDKLWIKCWHNESTWNF